MNHQPKVIVCPNMSTLCDHSAKRLIALGQEAIQKRQRFMLALSGGSTPERLYARLAEPDLLSQLEWARTHLFWSDERHVPPHHEASNYRLARQALLAKAHLPTENVHRVLSELPNTRQAASDYERALHETFGITGDEIPRFDLILLGLGEDGHTASLFPDTPALYEHDKLVAANPVAKLNTERITFTYPLINGAANVWFLVAGANKAEMVKAVLEGADRNAYPSQRVSPENGELIWLLDEPAAALLDPEKSEIEHVG